MLLNFQRETRLKVMCTSGGGRSNEYWNNTHTHTHTNTHINIHTHTHTNTHIYIHIFYGPV